MKLAYQRWSPKDKIDSSDSKRLVLLHGMGGTGKLWRPLAAGLENELNILAPDQRGHGGSQISELGGFTPLDYGKDVVDTIEDLGFHPTFILGHSMGVRTAVSAAHLRPEWCQGLILIDLGFEGVAGGGLGNRLGDFLGKLPKIFETRQQARRFMNENCPDPSIALYLMAVSVQSSSGQVSFPFDHQALIETIHSAQNFSAREWIRDLATQGMPILALRGANSKVWSSDEFENEKLRFQDLPSIRFEEVQDAGHGLPFEQREVLIQILRNWMAA